MTAERVAELEDMREKFGLSKESAQKIIRGAQNQHLIANMNVSPPDTRDRGTRAALSVFRPPSAVRMFSVSLPLREAFCVNVKEDSGCRLSGGSTCGLQGSHSSGFPPGFLLRRLRRRRGGSPSRGCWTWRSRASQSPTSRRTSCGRRSTQKR